MFLWIISCNSRKHTTNLIQFLWYAGSQIETILPIMYPDILGAFKSMVYLIMHGTAYDNTEITENVSMITPICYLLLYPIYFCNSL